MICTFFVHCNFQFDVEMEKKCKHELAEAASMDIELKKNPSKNVVKNAADKPILSSLLKLWSTIGAVMVIFLWVFMVELGTLGNRFVVQKYWVSSNLDSDSVPIERVYENNGYLMVTCNGGLNQMRTGICDMVTIARFLNLTLIVPELDNTSFWHDTSTFQDIFDVDYFIKSLRDEVRILKELPPEEESRLESTSLHSITPKLWSRMSFYYRKVLPEIRKRKVLHFNQSNTRLINNDLPDEIQKLRCRVNYNALRFTAPIEEIGRKIVRILRQKGPFLALHLRYEMDILSFTGCAQGLTHNETVELIKMRDFYPWWKTRGHPAKKRKGGGCPLTPGEAALALQSLGIDRNMRIYIASGDIYGGETRLAPLVEAYPNLVRKEKLLDPSDLKPFSGHWNQMAALDYTVSLESDIFVPTQAGNMALAVEGHRRYLGFRTTIMLNKKLLVSLIDQYKIGKLSWDDFSFIMKAAHADHMGKPKKRLKIPGQPQHEDSFYANPEECLPQMVKR